MLRRTSRTRQCLDQHGVAYVLLPHRRDYTARQTAHDCALMPAMFAKVVGLEADGLQFLAVLSADHHIDLARLRDLLGANEINLLSESALASFFPDCELGACPPLGHLYGLQVYIALYLTEQREIAFNGGTHEDVIKMGYPAFRRLVNPVVMDFTYPA